MPWGPFLAHLNIISSPRNTSHAGHSGEMRQAGVSTYLTWSPPSPPCPNSITLNPARAPACRSDSMFPGSRKAMLMRKPGPVKAHSFLRLNVPCGWEWGKGVLGIRAAVVVLGPPQAELQGAHQPRLASLALYSPFLEPHPPTTGVSGRHSLDSGFAESAHQL